MVFEEGLKVFAQQVSKPEKKILFNTTFDTSGLLLMNKHSGKKYSISEFGIYPLLD
jgi:hypothetical protein